MNSMAIKLNTWVINLKSSKDLDKRQSFAFYAWIVSFILLFSILFFFVGTGTLFATGNNSNYNEINKESSYSTPMATTLQLQLPDFKPNNCVLQVKSH